MVTHVRASVVTVAINGFGRIGRNFLRAFLQDQNARNHIHIAVINIGPADPKAAAHMFKYDTLLGTYPGTVTMQQDTLVVDDYAITMIAETDPKKINWKTFAIDWVVESSGFFTTKSLALKHCDAGASHVLITAPAKGEDVSIIMGINEHAFDNNNHRIVSMGSCTTNAFIPMLKIVQDLCGISQGFMTTVHAYTNSQVLLDVESRDLRCARAAALNIIPTTTGAASMLGKIMPDLAGKIDAVSIRVPVAKVSLIDLSLITKRNVTVEELNNAFKNPNNITMKNIVGFTREELVSSDFAGSDYSVVIDGSLTIVNGSMVKLFGWYDNEWAYSVRLKDFLMYVATKF